VEGAIYLLCAFTALICSALLFRGWYLLARRGVEVTLLERHADVSRTFRGDGLQPSGIDAFNQMGLGDKLMQLVDSCTS
jgi:hypothetical protein